MIVSWRDWIPVLRSELFYCDCDGFIAKHATPWVVRTFHFTWLGYLIVLHQGQIKRWVSGRLQLGGDRR
jgi:hypothetical protein